MAVIVHNNTYLVTKHIVSKNRTCSCGNKKCWAIQEVKRYLIGGGERAPDANALVNPPTPPSFDIKELVELVKQFQGGNGGYEEHPRYARPRYILLEPVPLTLEGKVDYWVWGERIKDKRKAFLNGTEGNHLEQWAREVLIARSGMTFENVGYLTEANG